MMDDTVVSDSDKEDDPEESPSEHCTTTSSLEFDDEERPPTQAELQALRERNVQALLSNKLDIQRRPLISKVLSVDGAEVVLRRAFKSPHPTASSCSAELRRKLFKRHVFVPWGSGSKLPELKTVFVPSSPCTDTEAGKAEEEAVDTNPLVLWEPPEGFEGEPVRVDKMLTCWLRPHQREGVAFMFECVTGLRKFEGQGCILADDMGLGKTLQGITLLWTLLQSGHEALGGNPIAKRVIICCPTSLVNNWDSECSKWLKGKVRTLPLCESSRDDVISSVAQFLSPRNPFQVLIVSYETFRLHADKFKGGAACDLLICDEAHRLKNEQTLTNKALDSLACKRRVLLSGTPMQNHLDEFYAMVNFCNPGVLGTPSQFRRYYEVPILRGREPDASQADAELAQERSTELSGIVNEFILRRTNALLSAHLPPKVVEVVCCNFTELQENLYRHFLESNAARRLLAGHKAVSVLTAITALKKLCNHPRLIYDALHSKEGKEGRLEGFEGCAELFLPGVFDDGRAGRPGRAMPPGWEMLSGKFALAALMLEALRRDTQDRIVIVSNYTQTLDLFATLCREKGYPCLRLDGSTTINKRQKLVKQFNDPADRQFVFLLSSKAGGCGLNLIGGNRLILFDPDWNPANDKQAAARVWRDGQKKRVFVYRFLTTGTIEEKVFQRQLSKEGLQSVVNSRAEGAGSSSFSSEELRDLFTLRAHTLSDTYDSLCCPPDAAGATGAPQEGSAPLVPVHRSQVGAPSEEELEQWGHHSSTATVPDAVLQRIGEQHPRLVSFVFSCEIEGMKIEEEGFGTRGSEVPTASPAVPPSPSGVGGTSEPRTPAALGAHHAALLHPPSRLSACSTRNSRAPMASAGAAGADPHSAAVPMDTPGPSLPAGGPGRLSRTGFSSLGTGPGRPSTPGLGLRKLLRKSAPPLRGSTPSTSSPTQSIPSLSARPQLPSPLGPPPETGDRCPGPESASKPTRGGSRRPAGPGPPVSPRGAASVSPEDPGSTSAVTCSPRDGCLSACQGPVEIPVTKETRSPRSDPERPAGVSSENGERVQGVQATGEPRERRSKLSAAAQKGAVPAEIEGRDAGLIRQPLSPLNRALEHGGVPTRATKRRRSLSAAAALPSRLQLPALEDSDDDFV